MPNIAELQVLIDEYLNSLDDEKLDEVYDTDKNMAAMQLNGFVEWLSERGAK